MHYHGTPITPVERMYELAGRCFCVRYGEHRADRLSHTIGQSVMLDNGAFSFWTQNKATDWNGYYEWAERWLDYPTTWAVIPDVIAGDAEANDLLLSEWPFGSRGAPVWHMHEPIERLLRLASDWPRVCIGSSNMYANVGGSLWRQRMDDAMNRLCGNGPVPVWLHMLRGMAFAGSEYPFASVDSTNIARNHSGNNDGRSRKNVKAMADEIDARQCPARWSVRDAPLALEAT